jgi:hypothetical protein
LIGRNYTVCPALSWTFYYFKYCPGELRPLIAGPGELLTAGFDSGV